MVQQTDFISNRIKIAWFGDLHREFSRSSTISAYYAECLLPYLADEFDLTFYTNTAYKSAYGPTRHYLCAYQDLTKNAFDLPLYNIEDGPESEFSRIHSSCLPGVSFFHDIFLNTNLDHLLQRSAWDNSGFLTGKIVKDQFSVIYERYGQNVCERELRLSPFPLFADERGVEQVVRLHPFGREEQLDLLGRLVVREQAEHYYSFIRKAPSDE